MRAAAPAWRGDFGSWLGARRRGGMFVPVCTEEWTKALSFRSGAGRHGGGLWPWPRARLRRTGGGMQLGFQAVALALSYESVPGDVPW